MIIACKLDDSKFTSEDIAEFIDLCKKCGIECNIPTQVPTVSTPTSKPKSKATSKPKALPPVADTEFPIEIYYNLDPKSNEILGGFKLGYGAGRKGAQLWIHSLGFKWDSNVRLYRGGNWNTLDPKAATDDPDDDTHGIITVPAVWIQAGRDKAAKRG